jgi:hypothetical protein
MRLPCKVFMMWPLLIGIVVGGAAGSLPTISPSVDADRGIAAQSLPALRMGTSLLEQPGGLTRSEMDARPVGAAPTGSER